MQLLLRAGPEEKGAQAPVLPAVFAFQIAADAVAVIGIGDFSAVIALDGAAELSVVDRVPGQRKHGIHAGFEKRQGILRAGQQGLLRFFPEKREKRGADESAQHDGGQQPTAQNHENQRYFQGSQLVPETAHSIPPDVKIKSKENDRPVFPSVMTITG